MTTSMSARAEPARDRRHHRGDADLGHQQRRRQGGDRGHAAADGRGSAFRPRRRLSGLPGDGGDPAVDSADLAVRLPAAGRADQPDGRAWSGHRLRRGGLDDAGPARLAGLEGDCSRGGGRLGLGADDGDRAPHHLHSAAEDAGAAGPDGLPGADRGVPGVRDGPVGGRADRAADRLGHPGLGGSGVVGVRDQSGVLAGATARGGAGHALPAGFAAGVHPDRLAVDGRCSDAADPDRRRHRSGRSRDQAGGPRRVVRRVLGLHQPFRRGPGRLDGPEPLATQGGVRPLSLHLPEPGAVDAGCGAGADHHDEPEPSGGAGPAGRGQRLSGQPEGRDRDHGPARKAGRDARPSDDGPDPAPAGADRTPDADVRAEDRAGHAVARAADGLAVVVVGVGVDHQGRAVGVPQPLAGAVLADAGLGGEELAVGRAVSGGVEVGQVAVVGALGVQQAVRRLGIGVVDVGAGRGEGGGALACGVDVDAVPAGRQARGLDLDQQAGRPLRQGRLADFGALTVGDRSLTRLARRSARDHGGMVDGGGLRPGLCGSAVAHGGVVMALGRGARSDQRSRGEGALLDGADAGRRPGQLRLGRRRYAGLHALHRGQDGPGGGGLADRHRKRHRRFPAELRREGTGARRPAGADSEPAGQRRGRHRLIERLPGAAGQPRHGRRGPAGYRARSRLPDGRRDHGPHRAAQCAARRTWLGHRARSRLGRGDPQGSRRHRHHRTAVPSEQADPDRTHRRNGAREASGRHLRRPRRVRPSGHAHRHRAEARRFGRRHPEPAVSLHGAAKLVRRQHAGAEPRPSRADGPAQAAGALPRLPRGSGRPPGQVRTGQGPRPRPRPGRSGRRRRQHRRGDPHHPQLGRPGGSARAAAGQGLARRRHDGPDRADRGPALGADRRRQAEPDRRTGARHPGPDPVASDRPRPRRHLRRGARPGRHHPGAPDHPVGARQCHGDRPRRPAGREGPVRWQVGHVDEGRRRHHGRLLGLDPHPGPVLRYQRQGLQAEDLASAAGQPAVARQGFRQPAAHRAGRQHHERAAAAGKRVRVGQLRHHVRHQVGRHRDEAGRRRPHGRRGHLQRRRRHPADDPAGSGHPLQGRRRSRLQGAGFDRGARHPSARRRRGHLDGRSGPRGRFARRTRRLRQACQRHAQGPGRRGCGRRGRRGRDGRRGGGRRRPQRRTHRRTGRGRAVHPDGHGNRLRQAPAGQSVLGGHQSARAGWGGSAARPDDPVVARCAVDEAAQASNPDLCPRSPASEACGHIWPDPRAASGGAGRLRRRPVRRWRGADFRGLHLEYRLCAGRDGGLARGAHAGGDGAGPAATRDGGLRAEERDPPGAPVRSGELRRRLHLQQRHARLRPGRPAGYRRGPERRKGSAVLDRRARRDAEDRGRALQRRHRGSAVQQPAGAFRQRAAGQCIPSRPARGFGLRVRVPDGEHEPAPQQRHRDRVSDGRSAPSGHCFAAGEGDRPSGRRDRELRQPGDGRPRGHRRGRQRPAGPQERVQLPSRARQRLRACRNQRSRPARHHGQSAHRDPAGRPDVCHFGFQGRGQRPVLSRRGGHGAGGFARQRQQSVLPDDGPERRLERQLYDLRSGGSGAGRCQKPEARQRRRGRQGRRSRRHDQGATGLGSAGGAAPDCAGRRAGLRALQRRRRGRPHRARRPVRHLRRAAGGRGHGRLIIDLGGGDEDARFDRFGGGGRPDARGGNGVGAGGDAGRRTGDGSGLRMEGGPHPGRTGARGRAGSCRAYPAAGRSRLLRQPSVAPGHRPVHGPDRRSAGHRRGPEPLSRPEGRVHLPPRRPDAVYSRGGARRGRAGLPAFPAGPDPAGRVSGHDGGQEGSCLGSLLPRLLPDAPALSVAGQALHHLGTGGVRSGRGAGAEVQPQPGRHGRRTGSHDAGARGVRPARSRAADGAGSGHDLGPVPHAGRYDASGQGRGLLDLRHRPAGSGGRSARRLIRPTRAAPATPSAGLLAVLAHPLQQQALAQAPVGDADALARPGALDRVKDRRARQHQIGAVGADAAFGRSACRAQGLEPQGGRLAVCARHPQAVDQIALIAAQAQVDAGQAGDRARGADHVDPPALEQAMHPVVIGTASGQMLADVGDHGLVPGLGVAGGFGVTLGQGDDAQGGRHPALAFKASGAAHHP
uniref:PE-PGRS family protein n=1 Tax=Parastrongyloides trichosuri TaxID=131310 RepID=A0A0N5A029_PARTI